MSECDPIDLCFLASLVCLCLGIIFSSLGLVINTDYKVNANLPAREMEQVERYYERLISFLRLCDIFGISMVTTGAALLLLAIVVMAIKGELFRRSDEPQEDKERTEGQRGKKSPLLDHQSTGGRLHGYGSNDPAAK